MVFKTSINFTPKLHRLRITATPKCLGRLWYTDFIINFLAPFRTSCLCLSFSFFTLTRRFSSSLARSFPGSLSYARCCTLYRA